MRGFWDQNLVRPSTADNRGLTVYTLYSQTSIIRGFWGQNLVRPTYMKCSQTSITRTSVIRGFWDENLVRPSTADNRGLTV